MKEMTRTEVEKILVDIFGIKKVENIIASDEDNILMVTIIVEQEDAQSWEVIEVEEKIELTPDTVRNLSFSKSVLNYHDYKEYMLNNGYNEYWRDNPFI